MSKFRLGPHPKLQFVRDKYSLKDRMPFNPDFLMMLERHYKSKSLSAIKEKFSLDDAMIGELVDAFEEDEAYLEERLFDEDPERFLAMEEASAAAERSERVQGDVG